MDLSGYRSRSAAALQAAYASAYHADPAGKRKRQRGLSLGARVAIGALLLLAAFLAIRRAGGKGARHTQAQAQAQQQPSASEARAAALRAKAMEGGRDAAKGAVEALSASHGKVSERLEASLASRIERQMRITPTYRGPGKADTFPHYANAPRLLLATHSRLMWYRYDTDELRVLHEGQGVYYGVFPGAERDVLTSPISLWAICRPLHWRADGAAERLLNIHLESGKELGSVQVSSRFAHDAVRRRDRVYVASTGDGAVIELSYPEMKELRRLPLFSRDDHVNTLAPDADGKLWAVLHKRGASDLVKVNLETGAEEARVPRVGTQAHGLVFWDKRMLTLDSAGGVLVSVDPASNGTDAVQQLWQVGDADRFLKGLCVVDDIAFFGVCPVASEAARADPATSCDLAAYDLKQSVLLWRRQLPTKGLLNVVAAPHLTVESTTYATNTRPLVSYRDRPQYAEALEAAQRWQHQQEREAQEAHEGMVAKEAAAQQQERATAAAAGEQQQQQQGGAGGELLKDLEQQGAAQEQAAATAKRALSVEQQAAADGGLHVPPQARLDAVPWSSGLPRLSLAGKAPRPGATTAGAQLPLLRTDVSAFKAALAALPEADWGEEAQRASSAWVEGRAPNLARFKQGTQSIPLLFSSQDGHQVARFPWYARFARFVDPLLHALLGPADAGNVMRLQLALMPGRGEIKRHMDSGGFAEEGHRIHVVLQSSPDVYFAACDVLAFAAPEDSAPDVEPGCQRIETSEGLAFELNNRLEHYVRNRGDQARIHLIIDVAEAPRQPVQLQPGEVCQYAAGSLLCPSAAATAAADDGAAEAA